MVSGSVVVHKEAVMLCSCTGGTVAMSFCCFRQRVYDVVAVGALVESPSAARACSTTCLVYRR